MKPSKVGISLYNAYAYVPLGVPKFLMFKATPGAHGPQRIIIFYLKGQGT